MTEAKETMMYASDGSIMGSSSTVMNLKNFWNLCYGLKVQMLWPQGTKAVELLLALALRYNCN